MCSHKRRPPFEEPPLKVCETTDFLAAVAPEAATETRTAPAPAIGACMTPAIAAATTISVIVNPNAAAPVSPAVMVLHVAVLFVTTHFFTASAPLALVLHLFASAPLALVLHLLTATTPTTPAAVIFSGDRCGTERETSGQRQ